MQKIQLKTDELSQNEGCSKIERFGMAVILLLLLAAMLFFAVFSLLQTTEMNRNNAMLECMELQKDHFLRNLCCLSLFFIGFAVLRQFLSHNRFQKKINAAIPALCIFLWIFLVGTIWIIQSQSAPTHDSLVVTRAGAAMAQGDSHYITESYYFRYFPFQLGYVLWTEIWSRILFLDGSNYLALEIINVLCLAAAEAGLVLATDRLFHRTSFTVLTAVMLACFVQPIIFCAFLYGNIPGFCFAVWGIYWFLRFCEKDKLRFACACAAFTVVSVGLKLNNMIVFAAIILIGLLRGLATGINGKTRLCRFAAVCIIAATVLGLKGFGQWQYEKRTGAEFGSGIPMICWMALGLHDSTIGPGWFSPQYTVNSFMANGEDPVITSQIAAQAIRERLQVFSDKPKEAAEFFMHKALSQWNETSFQSIWNNQVRGQYGDKTGIAAYVCGEGEYTVKFLMDQGVQIIYWGMLFAVIRLLQEKNPAMLLIPLTILGGMMYHELFEAKSQYVLTYVTLMLPYAAYGFQGAAEILHRIYRAIIKKIKPQTAG